MFKLLCEGEYPLSVSAIWMLAIPSSSITINQLINYISSSVLHRFQSELKDISWKMVNIVVRIGVERDAEVAIITYLQCVNLTAVPHYT